MQEHTPTFCQHIEYNSDNTHTQKNRYEDSNDNHGQN